MALKDPDLRLFQGLDAAGLPTVGIVPKISMDFKDGMIDQRNVDGNLPLLALLNHLAQLTGKMEDLQRLREGQKLTKVKRNFGEI